MSSALENEDLENVALVRMEDVQPSRARIDRTIELHIQPPDEQIFEYIDETVEYGNECEIDDDCHSNIGSMVSIHSEEIIEEEEDGSEGELIVPEILDVPEETNVHNMNAEDMKSEHKPPQSDSWPTLEILPGGVIKNAVDFETSPTKQDAKPLEKGEMMYACAKCSQVFKYLFCLVKHVRWHEDQNKKSKSTNLRKMTPLEKELVLIKKERNELDQKYKMQKIEILARVTVISLDSSATPASILNGERTPSRTAVSAVRFLTDSAATAMRNGGSSRKN